MKQTRDILSEKELNVRLVRDLTEEAAPDERESLAAWRASDPQCEAEYARIRSYWTARVATTRPFDPQQAYGHLRQRMETARLRGLKRPFTVRLSRYAAMAGVLTVGLIGGWLLPGPRAAAERYAYITGSSISSFELPDGSRITLNKESRLEFDGDYGRSDRRVQLAGEGFFEVRKEPEKAFVVEMGDVEVTVLGTTFDACNRVEEGWVRTSLVEGSVGFRVGNQHLLLTPSRQAVYRVGSGELSVSEFDPEITTAWKDNLLRYKSLTLEEMLDLLSERYDVRIIADGSVYGPMRFSGALETRLSIEQVLDIVARQTHIRWSKHDSVYFITKP